MNTNRFYNLKLALYCSSIIIGAGLLTLPLAAARLGFLPLLLVIVVGGIWMAIVNKRTADSLFSYVNRKSRKKAQVIAAGLRVASDGAEPSGPLVDHEAIIADHVRKHGSRILPELTLDAGFGMSGRMTILLGMFLYVFFADIGYVLIGSRSLAFIARFVTGNFPKAFPALFFGGLLLFILSLLFDRLWTKPFLLRGTLKKIFVMAGAWLVGISFLGYYLSEFLNQLGTVWMDALGLTLFTGAVLAGMFTNTNEHSMSSSGDLTDHHTVNVVVMLAEILLLVVTILIVLTVVNANHILVPFFGIAEKSLSLSALPAWSKLIGLVIFAFVGTGLFNLLSYPKLFEKPKPGSMSRLVAVVILGTVIPMIVYLAWTITSSTVLTPSELTVLDSAKEYITMGIARKFAEINTTAALLITIFGYSVALLAVTSACNGFTESLADQISATLHGITNAKWTASNQGNLKMRLIILVAAIAAAFAVDHLIKIDISSILSVAGNAGGGLLVLILPFFLPEPGSRKSRWSSVMIGLMTAITLTLLSLTVVDIAAVQDVASAVVAAISIVIAISISVMAIWLIRSEPPSDGTD